MIFIFLLTGLEGVLQWLHNKKPLTANKQGGLIMTLKKELEKAKTRLLRLNIALNDLKDDGDYCHKADVKLLEKKIKQAWLYYNSLLGKVVA